MRFGGVTHDSEINFHRNGKRWNNERLPMTAPGSESPADKDRDATNPRHWRFRDFEYRLGRFPLLMGIVNVTPDSFSDGGRSYKVEDAVRNGIQLVEDGADLLDVGGESTRPGSQSVSLEEELLMYLY